MNDPGKTTKPIDRPLAQRPAFARTSARRTTPFGMLNRYPHLLRRPPLFRGVPSLGYPAQASPSIGGRPFEPLRAMRRVMF